MNTFVSIYTATAILTKPAVAGTSDRKSIYRCQIWLKSRVIPRQSPSVPAVGGLGSKLAYLYVIRSVREYLKKRMPSKTSNIQNNVSWNRLYRYNWTRLIWFEFGHFEFPVISNSKPFSLDLPFGHLLSAISNSHYFEQFFVSPESWKMRDSTVSAKDQVWINSTYEKLLRIFCFKFLYTQRFQHNKMDTDPFHFASFFVTF